MKNRMLCKPTWNNGTVIVGGGRMNCTSSASALLPDTQSSSDATLTTDRLYWSTRK